MSILGKIRPALSLLCIACSGAAGCAVPVISDIPLLDPDHKNFNIEHRYDVRDVQFERTVGNLLGPPIVGGNSVVTLVNGDQIFPAMLKAVSGAQKTITFESYIYWNGDIGARFADAIIERAKAGVEVSIILDWFGTNRLDHHLINKMREAGARVLLYRELSWYDPRRWKDVAHVDNRTHRKLLVVDGKIGFTGGVGIADVWEGNADSPEHWRDTHFRFEGPVVLELQSAFEDNWLESGGEVLHGSTYFPEPKNSGSVRAQTFKGSAGEATANIELMYRLAIASAAKNITISSAYFVPDEGIVRSLIDAAKRGVKIEVLVPGHEIDNPVVRVASRQLWGEMLEAGIKIYEYQPTMFHCKSIIIDDYFVSVGSTNFDHRSFRLNDEVNVNIFDQTVANEQERIFAEDKTKAKEITLADWKRRPLLERIGNRMSLIFRDEL